MARYCTETHSQMLCWLSYLTEIGSVIAEAKTERAAAVLPLTGDTATSVPALSGANIEFTTQIDEPVDYGETANVANEAFAEPGKFNPSTIQWLYEKCFSLGATVISLRANGEKVGQFVIIRQKIAHDGQIIDAAQLVDLFVLPQFRSRRSMTALYRAVEQRCISEGIRYIIGMPNQKAISANEYFIGLKPFLWLDIRAGLTIPHVSRKVQFSGEYSAGNDSELTPRLTPYMPPISEDGIVWTAASLISRLSRPDYRYGIHATDNLLLISSPRQRKGIPYTLLCAFFPKLGVKPSQTDIRAVTSAACATWRRPLFVFPGIHQAIVGGPGLRLPQWLRPSTMLVQMREFDRDPPAFAFDRYQSLDFDFG